MKLLILLPLLYLFSGLSTVRADVRKQAEAIFKEAVRPDNKGSFRHLNLILANDLLKDAYSICEEKENNEFLSTDKQYPQYDLLEYSFPPSTGKYPSYNVVCTAGWDDQTYSIVFYDTNKELLDAIRELCIAYFDKHLTKVAGTLPSQYKLGLFTLIVGNVEPHKEDGNWKLLVHSYEVY